jgi:hypothetical protein
MSSFSLSSFKKTVPTKIVSEGETTFKQGCVKKIDSNKNNEWVAEVTIGNEVFNVEIMIDDEKNILDHFCDCPSETEHCRHQVATFLKLKEVLPTLVKKNEKAKAKGKEKAPPKPKKLSPIDSILAETSYLELQDFIRKNAASNKAFKNIFFVHFADKNENINRKYYVDLLKSTASNIKKLGYMGSRDTNTFLKTANEIAQKSVNSLETGAFKDFAPIGLAFIEISIALLKRMDSYELKKIISKQFEGLHEVAKKCPIELKNVIFKEFFEVLSANISDLFEVFGTETNALFKLCSKEKDINDVFINFLKDQNEGTNRSGRFAWEFKTPRNESNLYTMLVDAQRAFYEANGMTDKIPALLSKNLHNNQYRKEYINILLAKDDLMEAKKILEELFKHSFGNTGQIEAFWFDTITDIYQKLNDTEGMQKLHLYRFRQSQYVDLHPLTELRKTISEQQWNDIFTVLEKEIIKTQTTYGYYGYSNSVKKIPIKLGHFFAFDKRWNELMQMVIKNDDLDSYASFCDVLLVNQFENTYKILQKKLMGWFVNLYPQSYENLADVIAALHDHGDKTKTLFDEVIQKIRIFHLGKKSLIAALKKRGVEI